MPIDEQSARFLLTPDGEQLTAQASVFVEERTETLVALTRLRKNAAPDQCAAAWELATLRPRARAKFGPIADRLFVTRESLEQASGLRASSYHAAQFVAREVSHIHDLCGGIGADSLAFARAGLAVTLYETDPVRALFAQANAKVCEVSHLIDVRQSDVTGETLTGGAAWFDPARRDNGRRIPSPDDYVPSLTWAKSWAQSGVCPIGMKLSPAVDHSLAESYGASLEFISDGGECKEALLWREGSVPEANTVRAVLLTDGPPDILAGFADEPAPLELSAQCEYLYEPDPAVIRAHLVGTLAHSINACVFDPQIAYLTSDTLVRTPFARAYKVLERFAYSRRSLQNSLTRLGVGHVIIKKRGFPLEPDTVRGQLKLRGANSMIVVLARLGDGHVVFLCELA